MLLITTIVLFLFERVSAIAIWGQCGGIGWAGTGVCDSGTTCVVVNDYYSQCQPGGSGTLTVTGTSTASPQPTSGSGLNNLWVRHGKKFWGINADFGSFNYASLTLLIKTDLGAIAPENSMKWDATEPTRGTFNFGGADPIVNWATSNGKLIRGRTLVWHSQLPSWVSSVSDKNTLTSIIQNHVATVAGRYKGKIYSVSDVNYASSHSHLTNLYTPRSGMFAISNLTSRRSEILNEDGSLRSTVFYNVLGESYVTIAFAAAKAADSGAKLYITDYNMDSNNAKTQGMIRLLSRINTFTKYIEGIGAAMHLGAGGTGGVQAALTALAGTGVEVAIVDLQISGASPNDYVTVMKACLRLSQCVSITEWDATGLWGYDYKPNAAYNALISALA